MFLRAGKIYCKGVPYWTWVAGLVLRLATPLLRKFQNFVIFHSSPSQAVERTTTSWGMADSAANNRIDRIDPSLA